MKTAKNALRVWALPFLLSLPVAVLADGGDTDMIENNTTDSGGCENQEGAESDCPCNDTSNPDPDNGCVQLSVDMGRSRYSALTRGIVLQLKELQATSQLYSPDGFKVLAGYTVKRASWEKTAAGLPKWVMIASDGGLLTDFYFADGASVGVVPAGPQSRTKQRLAMVDAQGWATASDPVYYDFYPGDGSRWRFGAARTAPDYLSFIEHQTPAGRLETKQDLGLEIIRDSNGVLRQVATPARLADFVISGPDAYDLSVYPNDASCVTGARTAEGYCAIAAGAVPEVVWKFRNPSPGTCGVLNVTREAAGTESKTWTYTFVEAVNDFVLAYPNGVREDRSERLKSDDGATMVIRKESRDAVGAVFGKKESHYVKNNYKYLRQREIRDPGGLNLTTSYSYHSGGATDGLEKLRISEDGSWTRCEYDDLRRKTAEIRPWLDSPTNAPDSQCAVTRYGYSLFAPGDFLAYNDQRPRTEIKEICGVEVSRTYRAYPTNALGQAQEIEERAAFPGAPYGHASNPRTVKTYHASSAALPLPGRLATVAYPGGKTETCGYEYGTFNAATFVFTPDPGGGAWRETVTTSYGANGGVQALRSARVWNEKGLEVLNESFVEDGASFAVIGWKRMTYDRSGKLIETAYSDGRVVSATWGANCCGKESETSAEGTVTVYGYNLLKQKVIETKKGLAADGSEDISTLYAHDLAGRVLLTAVTNYASGLGYVASRNAYDAVGRVTNTVDRLGNPTVTAYDALATSVRRPNGVTAVTERYLDGQAKRVLENGTVRQSYAFGVSADGVRWTLSAQGALPDVAPLATVADLRALVGGLDFPWSFSVSDSLGRTVFQGKPGFGGSALVTSNAYDTAGNLLSTAQYAIQLLLSPSSLLLSQKLYSHAADGSPFLDALDLNTNGVIDLDGPDRVTGTASAYEKDASNLWWQVSRSWVYPEFNSASAVTTSVQRVRLTGLGVQRGGDGVLVSQSETLDVRGNATVSETLVDRENRRGTGINALPISVQPEMRVMENGLLLKTVSSTAVTNTFGYDVLGRQTASTDGRGNTTVTAYNAIGQVLYTEDAATNRTTYGYDFLGRRTSVTDALSNTTHTAYNAEGRVITTWGATYPVVYAYDAQGRMTAMATTRDGALDFSTVTNSSLLNPNSSLDVTRWLYDEATGLLTNKLYADGLGPAYTYTPDGQLAARVWARGVATAYTYVPFSGELVSADYSDSTPDIAYTYGRIGSVASVADASGTRTFVHSPDGLTLADSVQFQDETFTFHEAYNTFGRSAGYALSNSVGGVSSLVAGTAQGYDAFGRISAVSVAGIPSPFRYGWLSGSDLQQSLIMPNGVIRQTAYDPLRDLPVSVTHSNAAGTVLTRRTFAYDAAGRLTDRTQYRLGDETNRLDTFGYNLRSELTSAALGTNAYAYAFDPIGNRMSATENTETAEYSANALNQYTNVLRAFATPCEFSPLFDLDGNQTLIRTSTGIWHVRYNAENRPVCFSNDTIVVEMAYDYMGRRFEYKETASGVPTRHERYLYRSYLQIAALDLLDSTNIIHTVAWDPTESVATRPLALQTPSGWFTYAFDQVKNVTELFDASGTLAETYDYAPFGALTAATGPAVSLNPLTFSSEIGDTALGLQYYNFRHLNTLDGRWLSRDPIGEGGGVNVFVINNNGGINDYDILGLMIVRNDVPSVVVSPPIVISPPSWPPSTTPPVTPDCMCEPGSKRGVRPDPLYTQPAPNGCGPGWSGDVKLNDPMKFVFPFFQSCSFQGACNNHDNCYGTCGSSKSTCDGDFHAQMRSICDGCAANKFGNPAQSYLWRTQCYAMAAAFAAAVSQPIGNPFDGSQDDACEDCCCP
ncbi:MAG: RHS repeat-associated core domain-containing protein [Kiritimatiellia bacterium]|nr:hypothetical protein [Kiritimatiellia bacterium]MDD4172793.1 hypothetical protein [Kiritimatiellia bacterium]MDX9792045.1 RHS repeat-associated core domain-containing protein [Kiritimatiellia bacterium]